MACSIEESYGLRVTGCGLRVTGYGLRVTALRAGRLVEVASYEFLLCYDGCCLLLAIYYLPFTIHHLPFFSSCFPQTFSLE